VSSLRVARVVASDSPSSSAATFVHAARLRRSSEIALVRSNGTQLQHRLFALRARPNGLLEIRVAISAPRALGRAVARNRVRRRLREAFRLAIGAVDRGPGLDLLIVARAAAGTVEHGTLRAAAAEALERLAPTAGA